MPDFSLIMIFMIGLAGGVHCIGMCGGLSSAFALQLPPHIGRFRLIVLLNLGRITSYTLAGLIFGGLAQWGMDGLSSDVFRNALFVFSQLILLFLGLYIMGLSGAITRIESVGKPIWRLLNPIMTRLLPIKSVPACFGVGMLWGWLPCGLVYSALTYALSTGSAVKGGIVMLTFALGTLPNLLLIGFFAVQLKQFFHHVWVRRILGLMIVCWSLFMLYSFFS